MSPILKLDEGDEKRELEFEIDYLLSISQKERFEMMFAQSDRLKKMLLKYGHRRPFKIIKR